MVSGSFSIRLFFPCDPVSLHVRCVRYTREKMYTTCTHERSVRFSFGPMLRIVRARRNSPLGSRSPVQFCHRISTRIEYRKNGVFLLVFCRLRSVDHYVFVIASRHLVFHPSKRNIFKNFNGLCNQQNITYHHTNE